MALNLTGLAYTQTLGGTATYPQLLWLTNPGPTLSTPADPFSPCRPVDQYQVGGGNRDDQLGKQLKATALQAGATRADAAPVNASSKLLNSDKAARAHSQYQNGDHRILSFKYNVGGGQSVTTLGTTHSPDPNSLATKKLVANMQDYFDNTPPDKQRVILETPPHESVAGETPPVAPKSLADSMQGGAGEFGAATFLAGQRDHPVEVVSGDGSTVEKAKDLKNKGFSDDAIGSFFATRILSGGPKTADEMYQGLARISHQTGGFRSKTFGDAEDLEGKLKDNPDRASELRPEIDKARQEFTHEAVSQINHQYEKLFGHSLIKQDDKGNYNVSREDMNKLNDPRNSAVAAAESDARNHFYLQSIQKAVAEGKSPIFIGGGSHSVGLDPALRSLYTPTSTPSLNDPESAGWFGIIHDARR